MTLAELAELERLVGDWVAWRRSRDAKLIASYAPALLAMAREVEALRRVAEAAEETVRRVTDPASASHKPWCAVRKRCTYCDAVLDWGLDEAVEAWRKAKEGRK